MWRRLLRGIKSFFHTPTGEEARDRSRVLCRYSVLCRLRPEAAAFPASVVDISRTGMRLEDTTSLRPGDRIYVEFVPGPGPNEQPLEGGEPVQAEVMWCRKRPHDGKQMAGVRYASPLEGTWLHHVLVEVGLAREESRDQKRKHIRLATALRAEVRDWETGQHVCEGKVVNMSVGGILVQTERPPSTDHPVLVLISPYNNYPILSLQRQILNCREDVEEGYSLLSVQFTRVSARNAKTLKRYVANLLRGRAIG